MKINKLFIKDSAIQNKESDAFSYEDYVNNLKMIIEHNEAPFNIAIVGKWGVGKSSIINMLKEELKGKSEYKIQEINAWKYENTSLKKAFLKELYKNLNGKEDTVNYFQKLFHTTIAIKDKEETTRQFIKKSAIRTFAFLGYFLISSIVLYVMLMCFDLFSLWISYNNNLSKTWSQYIDINSKINVYGTIKSFKDKIFLPLLLVGIGEISKFISAYKTKKILRYEITPPIESTDEYEEKFNETLDKYKERNSDFTKLVIVIDDLDRLSAKKIVDALDAIKAFVERRECVFIVPFDDTILRKAINSKRMINDTNSFEGDSYLDKLFQFKIILPPLIDMDMQEYAYKLCKNEIPEIFNLCPSFKALLEEVLIYPYVSTPRQIKKIINTFVSNLLIVKSRENKKLEAGLITNNIGIKVLAKVSVLQADFPEFYNCLLQDRELMKIFMDKYYSNKGIIQLKELEPYGIYNDETFKALASFLIKTEYINADNLSPYIYLGQDSLGLSAGDKKQRSIRKDLLSGNEMDIITYSDDNKLSLVDVRIIIQGIKEMKSFKLQYALKVGLQLVNYISDEMITEFANLVSNKLNLINEHSIEFRYWQVNYDNYLAIYEKATEKQGIEKTILIVLNNVLSKSESWKQKNGEEYDENSFNKLIQEILKKSLEKNIMLSEEIRIYIKEFINNKEYPIGYIIDIYNNHRDLIKQYFRDEFYEKLCKYIGSGEDIDDRSSVNKAFEEIALTIREEDIEKFSAPLSLIIYNEIYATQVCELILPVAEDISIKNGTELVNQFISLKYSQGIMKTVANIIIVLNWNIDNTNNENLNNFIISCFELEHFLEAEKLLSNKINPSKYKLVSKVINIISDKCFVDGSYDNVLNSIINNLTAKQVKYITDKIQSNFILVGGVVNNDLFKRSIIITKLLLENKLSHELLSDIVEKLMINYNSTTTYTQSYPLWSEAFTEVIGMVRDIISDSKLEEYVMLLITYVISYNPNIMIKGLFYLGQKIPLIYKKESINKVMQCANTFDTKVMAIKYLRNMRESIDDEKDNLRNYSNFLLQNIDLDNNNILGDFNDTFESITEDTVFGIAKYLKDKDNYNRKFALSVIDKFLIQVNKEDCIRKLLLLENDTNSMVFIKDVIELNNMEEYKEVITSLINNISDEDTILYLLNLIKLVSYYKNKFDKKLIANIVNHVWTQFGDNEIISLSQILIKDFSEFKFNNGKSVLNERIVAVFRKSNNEAKRSLLEIAKIFEFVKVFRDALKTSDLSDEERILIKEVLKFR
ncbi:KAP family P-loop NTPase fold protein [Clostridium estertheticum]|uniref:KAP NTPase domain-containing protein n=1 Tax=Clostridium estertheticum TaxID=238834 RepID=A0A7Y3WTF5_9CLOT|nr:P-loop NTPase fold protein [Clostridium estertheticum]NNU78117.1 hypothetical protein [Clostridium estertheticum]WBL47771.1 KAP family NTPase [Clostridium estertheticum]